MQYFIGIVPPDEYLERVELLEMKSEAGYVFAPFPTFTVSYVRVYKEVQPNKYQLYEDIKLAL